MLVITRLPATACGTRSRKWCTLQTELRWGLPAPSFRVGDPRPRLRGNRPTRSLCAAVSDRRPMSFHFQPRGAPKRPRSAPSSRTFTCLGRARPAASGELWLRGSVLERTAPVRAWWLWALPAVQTRALAASMAGGPVGQSARQSRFTKGLEDQMTEGSLCMGATQMHSNALSSVQNNNPCTITGEGTNAHHQSQAWGPKRPSHGQNADGSVFFVRSGRSCSCSGARTGSMLSSLG